MTTFIRQGGQNNHSDSAISTSSIGHLDPIVFCLDDGRN